MIGWGLIIMAMAQLLEFHGGTEEQYHNLHL